jgi:hypothetical protein
MAPMLVRTPKREAKRHRQQRWRARQRRDVLVVTGEVPRSLIETLIDYEWLELDEAKDRQAIMQAMVAALRTVPRRTNQ